MSLTLTIDIQGASSTAELDAVIARLDELASAGQRQASSAEDTARANDGTSESFERKGITLDSTVVKFTALTAAIGASILALRGLSRAGLEGQRDFTRLDAVLSATGAEFGSADASIQAFFGTLQATTRFSGGEAAQAMAVIARRTAEYRLEQEQLVAITRISAGVAEATGQSIAAASEIVVRALEGESRALRQLGIDADEHEDVLAVMQERYGSLAEQIDAFDLAQARLRNGLDDLARVVGTTINSSEALRTTVASLATGVDVLVSLFDQQNVATAQARAELAALIPFADGAGISVDHVADAADFLVQAFTIASNTMRVGIIVFEAVRGASVAAASAVLSLSTVIVEGLVRAVSLGMRGLEGLYDALGAVASIVPGMDGIAERFTQSSAAISGAREGVDGFADDLAGLRRELVDVGIAAVEGAGERITETAEDMARATRASSALRDELRDLFAMASAVGDTELAASVSVLLDRDAVGSAADEVEAIERASLSKREDAVKRAIAEIERARGASLARTEDLEGSFLDRAERSQRDIAEAAVAFGFDLETERTEIVARAIAEREALRSAETQAEIEEIEGRIALLQDFARAQQDIREEELRQRERDAALIRAQTEALARDISNAAQQAGRAIGNIFSGADPGTEFAALIRAQIGDIVASLGYAVTAAGLAQLLPGPLFNPVAGGLNVALGASLSLGAGILGATAPTPSLPGGAAAAPAPAPTPARGLDTGPQEQRVTTIIDARSGVTSNPIQTAQDIRRLERAGARAGQMPGRGYT